MVKIFYPNSGSQESLYKYQDVTVVQAVSLVKKALEEQRLVINLGSNARIATLGEIKDDDVIRVFPIVGGG